MIWGQDSTVINETKNTDSPIKCFVVPCICQHRYFVLILYLNTFFMRIVHWSVALQRPRSSCKRILPYSLSRTRSESLISIAICVLKNKNERDICCKRVETEANFATGNYTHTWIKSGLFESRCRVSVVRPSISLQSSTPLLRYNRRLWRNILMHNQNIHPNQTS